MVLSAASKASPISSPGNNLGKTAVILLPFVMTEGELALQKKLSSMIVPMTTSFLVPMETYSGFSNLNLKKMLPPSIPSTRTSKPSYAA